MGSGAVFCSRQRVAGILDRRSDQLGIQPEQLGAGIVVLDVAPLEHVVLVRYDHLGELVALFPAIVVDAEQELAVGVVDAVLYLWPLPPDIIIAYLRILSSSSKKQRKISLFAI